MKKQMMIATGLAVLSTSAFATKARLEALGQGTDRGSLFISDSRSVFSNAADVNNYNNYVVTEWGSTGGTAGVQQNPEGGFFKTTGNFAYGLYLNSDFEGQDSVRADAASNGYAESLRGTATTGLAIGNAALQSHDNAVDLFFGGDMGIQWGARVHYAKGKNEPAATGQKEAKHSALGLGLGVIHGDISAYANITLNDESENLASSATEGAKWEADGVLNLGAAYVFGDLTFFADYDAWGAKFKADTATLEDKTEKTVIAVGVGHTHEVSSSARVFTSVTYQNTKAEDTDGAVADNKVEVKRSELPVVFGFEADANSWLTLRGSIQQNLLFNEQEVKTAGSTGITDAQTRANTADVNAGATLNFGKLKIDGMIGTSSAAGTVGTEDSTLSLDRLMSKVAVHYWF